MQHRFVTLRAVSKACMLWRLTMTDLQVWPSSYATMYCKRQSARIEPQDMTTFAESRQAHTFGPV